MFVTKRIAALASTVALLALAACGSSTTTSDNDAGPSNSADPGTASAVTPVSDDVISKATSEGSVVIYTSADDQVMAPLIKAFEAKYPGITVHSTALDDSQIFQRYQTEHATGAASADIVMAQDQVGFEDFIDGGNVLDYEDPNVPNLPDYANLAPGVVAISEDPLIAVFNKAVLPKAQQPTSMEQFAQMAPQLKGKIATTDIKNPVQLLATDAYLNHAGDSGWDVLEALGPNTGVESNTGNLAQKLLQGQYAASFFISGALRALITGDAAKVLNWSYLTDGTPLIPRAMAITAGATHPNAAKLFENYALSVEGQEAACKGGFSPYRSGVVCPFGISSIEQAVGKGNLIVGGWDPDLSSKSADIISQWNDAFGR